MSTSIVNSLTINIKNLEDYVEQVGLLSYDPYDILSIPFVLKITELSKRNFIYKSVHGVLAELFLIFPLFFRKLFKVEKRVYPQSLALLASGYINNRKTTGNTTADKKIHMSLTQLLDLKSTVKKGIAWGCPFDWQSQILIPKHTPNGVSTTLIGETFWKAYVEFGHVEYRDVCVQIAKFLLTLPKDHIGETICFSYTALYVNHVHNLNLFIAEYLIKVGLEIDDSEMYQIGMKAADYTLSDQSEEGFFEYYGIEDRKSSMIDHYHTCFVLRMLRSIFILTNDIKFKNALDKCYSHYINNLFTQDYIPKFKPDRTYRIDVHSCAESIHTLALLSEYYEGALDIADKVYLFSVNELQDKKGYFYHGIFKSKLLMGLTFKSKISYHRWANGWMLQALTSYRNARESIVG